MTLSADSAVTYIHLPSGNSPPDIGSAPCRMVVVIEQDVTIDWQSEISDWIVNSGCLYMMAWGNKCTEWDDSVDWANLEQFDYGDIPDDDFVMTTWHENEPLHDVLWFCRMAAFHPTIELPDAYIVHIAPKSREDELISMYWTEPDEE